MSDELTQEDHGRIYELCREAVNKICEYSVHVLKPMTDAESSMGRATLLGVTAGNIFSFLLANGMLHVQPTTHDNYKAAMFQPLNKYIDDDYAALLAKRGDVNV